MPYCGKIALIGRSNVGKSTLLNAILGEKCSITSCKPQTTRHALLGIHTQDVYQSIYVDTPGLQFKQNTLLHRSMRRAAYQSMIDVHVIGLMVDIRQQQAQFDNIAAHLITQLPKIPCVLIMNKIDTLKRQEAILPMLAKLKSIHPFAAIIPISAKKKQNIARLIQVFQSFLPEAPFQYEPDQYTDRSVRFLCAELLREKLFRFLGQELPYTIHVEIETYKMGDTLDEIHALIWVDKPNHRRMVIGEKGQKLKQIATAARHDMERLIGKKVFLKCFCKIKPGWFDGEHILNQFGY